MSSLKINYLNGKWLSADPDSRLSLEFVFIKSNLFLRAYDLIDGELFDIKNVSFNYDSLSIKIFIPSTNYSLDIQIITLNIKKIFIKYTYVDIWRRQKKIDYKKSDAMPLDLENLLGTWMTESEHSRLSLVISYINDIITIKAFDLWGEDIYEVRNIRFDEVGLRYELYTSELDLIIEGLIIKKSKNRFLHYITKGEYWKKQNQDDIQYLTHGWCKIYMPTSTRDANSRQ